MQVLELIFAKKMENSRFSIDTPITPIDAQVVNQVMDTISPHLYFHPLMKIHEKGARLVEKMYLKFQLLYKMKKANLHHFADSSFSSAFQSE